MPRAAFIFSITVLIIILAAFVISHRAQVVTAWTTTTSTTQVLLWPGRLLFMHGPPMRALPSGLFTLYQPFSSIPPVTGQPFTRGPIRSWFEYQSSLRGQSLVVPLWVISLPFAVSAWLTRPRRGRDAHACPDCRYDLRNLLATRCPECGYTLRSPCASAESPHAGADSSTECPRPDA